MTHRFCGQPSLPPAENQVTQRHPDRHTSRRARHLASPTADARLLLVGLVAGVGVHLSAVQTGPALRRRGRARRGPRAVRQELTAAGLPVPHRRRPAERFRAASRRVAAGLPRPSARARSSAAQPGRFPRGAPRREPFFRACWSPLPVTAGGTKCRMAPLAWLCADMVHGSHTRDGGQVAMRRLARQGGLVAAAGLAAAAHCFPAACAAGTTGCGPRRWSAARR